MTSLVSEAARPSAVPLFSVLNTDGTLVGRDPGLGDEQLVELFGAMVRTRAFDRRATSLRRQGRIGEYYRCEGQEALAGAAFALAPEDWIYTAYRDQPAWFTRGLPYAAVLALYKGIPSADWDTERYRITRMNATIGTHLPHAVGAMHAARLRGEPGAALVLFSDGATSEGDFHAGLNFAGVWRTPTIFLCQNNQYAQSVPLAKQTAGVIADRGLGYGLPGVRVDGMDPLAMYLATRDALSRARAGEGPTLIEMVTYRYHGHATFESNPLQYRPAGEPEAWMEKDPLKRMRGFLRSRGLLDDQRELGWVAEVHAACDAAMARFEAPEHPDRAFAVLDTYARVPRSTLAHLHQVQRDLGEPETVVPEGAIFVPGSERPLPDGPRATMTHVQAIRAAIHEAMLREPDMVCIGEDIGADGGCFKATEGLLEVFGPDRVIDSPLCETGIMGTAIGMAGAGVRVMAEIQLAGFIYPALDQLVGHAARMRSRYRGARSCPLVLRMPGAGGFRGHEFHMDCPEALVAHMPGTFVVASSDPIDAKGLLAAALQHDDPVVFFEPVSLYRTQKAEVPLDPYTIPLGRAHVARRGSDVTVVAYGRQVGRALTAAERAAHQGVDAEVINLRTLRPWDEETVLGSVARTGRLVTVHDAHRSHGVGAEIAARVAEELPESLRAPLIRVATFDGNRPSLAYERLTDIDDNWILAAIFRSIEGGRR